MFLGDAYSWGSVPWYPQLTFKWSGGAGWKLYTYTHECTHTERKQTWQTINNDDSKLKTWVLTVTTCAEFLKI